MKDGLNWGLKVGSIVAIVCILICIPLGIWIGYKYVGKCEQTQTKDFLSGNKLEEKEIKNEEVAELYKKLIGDEEGYNPVYIGYTPINTEDDLKNDIAKLSILVASGAIKSFEYKVPEDALWNSIDKYTTTDELKKAYFDVFNKKLNLDGVDTLGICPQYFYDNDTDKWYLSHSCGSVATVESIKSLIYKYEESENGEITVYTAYAGVKIYGDSEKSIAKYVGELYGIHNWVDVYDNVEDFYFTDENIKDLNVVVYKFKKNENGKYYVDNWYNDPIER